MKHRTSGFTLIELLVVTVVISILSALGVPVYEGQKEKANDAWAHAVVANVAKIVMADSFIDASGVNFADLDGDNSYVGTTDPVNVLDLQARLDNQDYILVVENRDICFLYGYESTGPEHDDMIVVANKTATTGTGSDGFSFSGTDDAKSEARSITSISCTPGSEGATGGDWTGYQWLNMIP